MGKCFIIQPFDKDKFDRRYADTYEPAIKNAGLEPYRVDRDPGVRVPIQHIEEGIMNSDICFAEITTDNPNVWYELGFAFACEKDVVMVCGEERQQFPFDIQHKQIIKYKTGSKSDFEHLENQITEKITALLRKSITVKRLINPIKENEGLKPHELAMVLLIIENQHTEEDCVSIYGLKNDMNRAGFTDAAFSITIRELKKKGFLETFATEQGDINGLFQACRLTPFGEDWILSNQHLVEMKQADKKATKYSDDGDLPF